jgi:myo-inositol 2-dehydrogenase/D-chiro-inositol 1-dehydrogenase
MAACLVDPMFAELGDVDTSIVTIRFESGALAVIDNSRRSGYGYDLRTEIFGAEGAIFVGFHQDTPVTHFGVGGVTTDHVHFFLERFDQAYVDEVRDFVAAAVERRPVRVTGADGRAAMAMAYAAEASLKERRPVEMSRFAPGATP